MVLKEALKENFAVFGTIVEDEAVLNKCLDICDLHDLSEEALVETWMAYSVSQCGGEPPTVESLCQMERKEMKKDIHVVKSSKNDTNLSQIAAFNAHSSRQYVDQEEILGLYGCKTPTTSKIKRLRSPEAAIENGESKLRAIESPFSPSSYTPKTETPSRFSAKTNRGQVLMAFGNHQPSSWKNSDKQSVEIKKTDDPHVPPKAVYMYEQLVDKATILDLHCQDIRKRLVIEELEEENLEWGYATDRNQSPFNTFGRICCDTDGKLNNVSILLEGPPKTSSSTRIKLDLSHLRQYSLFPGQVVGVQGYNPTGNVLIVKKLYPHDEPPLPRCPKITRDLHIVVAAGPFTQPDNLKYEPMLELLEYVLENTPHVLILLGPFVEYSHPDVQNCSMSLTFDDFFEQCIGNIMNTLRDTSTQVVLIASNRDAHHEPIFPTPEYQPKQKYANLHLMPDPCMLDIDGLIIGNTSVDIMMHMSREEISLDTRSDRLTRIAAHVMTERCFYPLVPSSEEVNVDMNLWEKYAFMQRQPHVLILPSNLRYFASGIYQSLVLNPGKLAKSGFARLCVSPPNKSGWSARTHVACEMLRL